MPRTLSRNSADAADAAAAANTDDVATPLRSIGYVGADPIACEKLVRTVGSKRDAKGQRTESPKAKAHEITATARLWSEPQRQYQLAASTH